MNTSQMALTSMDDGILSNYTEFCRIGLNNLEFDGTHTTTDEKSIPFANGSVCCNAVKSIHGNRSKYDFAYLQGSRV